jgi:hypothetical protein
MGFVGAESIFVFGCGLDSYSLLHRYKEGVEAVDNDTSDGTVALRLALRLNVAACDVKLGHWADAVAQCSEALKLDKVSARTRARALW